jgi:hypothetical protein
VGTGARRCRDGTDAERSPCDRRWSRVPIAAASSTFCFV